MSGVFTLTAPVQPEEGLPDLDRVRDDVWSLAIPMVEGSMPYTNCYLLRASDGGIHVVDPGWDSELGRERLFDALTVLGAAPTDLRSVIVTHLHADHLGMADRLRVDTGAEIVLHRQEVPALVGEQQRNWTIRALTAQVDSWEVPPGRRPEILALAATPPAQVETAFVGRVVDDGDTLDVPGFALEAVHTPGHTPGHLCLVDSDREIVFTGDHVLPNVFAGIGLGGPAASNPLSDYLASIRRISAFDAYEALPGHGFRFTGLADRAEQSAEHHLRRTRQVEALLADGRPFSIWELASRLTWSAGWEGLHDFTLFSALSQTAIHRDHLVSTPSRSTR